MATTTTTTASVPDHDFLFALAQTDVFNPLPATSLEAVLSSPPFVPVPGTFNARDLGLVPGSPIRPGRLYRTGVFSSASSSSSSSTADSRSELEPGLGLGVGRMFDLRTAGERARRPEPVVDGVEAVWIAPDEGGEAAPGLKDFEEGEGEKGVVRMYLDVMRLYRRGIKRLLEQVGEGWDRGALLFHCNGELFMFPFVLHFLFPFFSVLPLDRVLLTRFPSGARPDWRGSCHPAKPGGRQRRNHRARLHAIEDWNRTSQGSATCLCDQGTDGCEFGLARVQEYGQPEGQLLGGVCQSRGCRVWRFRGLR
ncbi:hypothetical protein VTI28DRAFT_4032 [Corynascus sepedonium]